MKAIKWFPRRFKHLTNAELENRIVIKENEISELQYEYNRRTDHFFDSLSYIKETL